MEGHNFDREVSTEVSLLKADNLSVSCTNIDMNDFLNRAGKSDSSDKYVNRGVLPDLGIYDNDCWQHKHSEPGNYRFEPLEPGKVIDITLDYKQSQSPASAARDRAYSELTPKEQRQYDEEQKELANWQRQRMMMESIGGYDYPPPHSPISDRVNKRAGEIEQSARDAAYAKMPERERQLLDQERKEYENQLANYLKKVTDPAEATINMPPMPMPGQRMRDFEAKVRNEIQKGNPTNMSYFLPLDIPNHRYV